MKVNDFMLSPVASLQRRYYIALMGSTRKARQPIQWGQFGSFQKAQKKKQKYWIIG